MKMIQLTIPGPPVGKWPIPVKDEDVLLSVSCDGDPVAHQRPRQGRGGHFYTPEKTRAYRQVLVGAINEQAKGKSLATECDLTFGVQVRFYRGTRQRIDVDNMLKTILDAITQSGFWLDDSRVHEICGTVEKGVPHPRVEFIIYRYHLRGDETKNGEYDFAKKCAFCEGALSAAKSKSYPSTRRKFCSQECARASKRDTLKCSQCGEKFMIPKSLHRKNRHPSGGWYPRRFCSRKCSIEFHRHLHRIRGKESDKWICTRCGGRVSRKEYKVCFGCAMQMRSDPGSNYWKLHHPNKAYFESPRVNIVIEELT